VLRLCEFYPGICLTTEEKARKNLGQGTKNLSQVKKNLTQRTVYILPKHPHITKSSQTHTLQNPHIHTRARAHTRITKQYKTTKITTNFWLKDSKEIDRFKGLGVDGERIVRLVFRKLR